MSLYPSLEDMKVDQMQQEIAEKPAEGPPPAYSPTSHTAESQPLSSTPSEKPPPYSVLGQLRDAKTTSDGNADMMKKICALTLCSTGFVILMTVLMIGLPIAMIVIGAIHKDDCPRQRFIPIYLIVGGSFALIRGLGNCGHHMKKRRQEQGGEEVGKGSRGVDSCGFLVDTFMAIWFICGCVWVYTIHKHFQSDFPGMSDYCDATVYWFTFWLLTTSFILMALMITCSCCVMCFACCAGRSN